MLMVQLRASMHSATCLRCTRREMHMQRSRAVVGDEFALGPVAGREVP